MTRILSLALLVSLAACSGPVIKKGQSKDTTNEKDQGSGSGSSDPMNQPDKPAGEQPPADKQAPH